MAKKRAGRKPAFVVAFIGALFSTIFYYRSFNGVEHIWMSSLMGFFQLALFAGFAIYLPELFPTRLRSTGTSFCYNVGRFIAATGPFTFAILKKGLEKCGYRPNCQRAQDRFDCPRQDGRFSRRLYLD